MSPLAALFRRFRRADAGTASTEFVLVFPLIMMSFFMACETGIYALRQGMLERALNITTRALRLGEMANPTNATIAASICNLASVVIANCTSVLKVELQDITTTNWTPLATNATCVNRTSTIQPVTTITQGKSDDMMIIRVCALVQPVFPGVGVGLSLPKDPAGGYALVATSAFVNEPK